MGGLVDSERSTSADDRPSSRRTRGASAPEGLTRAQARALSRSAPLTPGEFKARRELAERRAVSLRSVLEGRRPTRPRPPAP